MRKWGLVVTFFYALIVLVLLVPAAVLLVSSEAFSLSQVATAYRSAGTWFMVGIAVAGEVLLLWLSVDTTKKRLKPRTHIAISALTTGAFLALTSVVVVLAVALARWGDKGIPDSVNGISIWSALLVLWLIWSVVFYRMWRNASDPVTRAVAWLFRGSVLELLVAVPAHVIVRRRHDCCAPIVTSFGIYSGIAIMLLSFGPSVLLLYKKRMERYARNDRPMK